MSWFDSNTNLTGILAVCAGLTAASVLFLDGTARIAAIAVTTVAAALIGAKFRTNLQRGQQ
ncbi:hypothetical protein JCM3263A_15140 [Thermobifida fusca]|jgi:membrane protein implicated in regulation of membrane protease activity|uniref:hypothetical protein n=1 Tax=Thermobifida TaxID=83677 RepID=UPI00077C590C|nr:MULTISPECIES: hypothetical protein [Thermobifida]MBO2528662.1 hypothetical protein [Thermobifida sp.]MDD6792414.1 hypothetical protein [Thermobifida fusca]PZN61550.1 MAG: hypothetical protein DIU53_12845 [Thermobifida fusca]